MEDCKLVSRKLSGMLVLMLLAQLPLPAIAHEAEDEEFEVLGLEAEKLLSFGSAHLALALGILALVAYARTKRIRMLFVALAFILFSAKLFLVSSELFIKEIAWVDPVQAFLDFIILLSFFYGVIKK